MLVTEGGSGKSRPWKKTPFIPYERLRKSWQKVLLDNVEMKVAKRPFRNLKNNLYFKYREGFYVCGKGEVKNEKAATTYVGRYTGRPAIANSRIVKYDGKKVTIYYERHEDGKRVEEEMDVIEFIKKVIIHIPEKQFKMVRYYGIYANHTRKRPYLIKMINEKILELKRKYKTWRYRIVKTFGHDPLACPKCDTKIEVIYIYYPKYGSVLEMIRQREYDRIEKQIKEIQESYNSVKNLSGGRIEPVFT